MTKEHHYQAFLQWTGNKGKGTAGYSAYERSYDIRISGKPVIEGSSDPAFRGDPARYNPEELLLASLSSCHMLWYLHLCAVAGVIVIEYTDSATGTMSETPEGGGRFAEVVLHPVVTVAAMEMVDKAIELHKEANRFCFIANSVNFPVRHSPVAVPAV